MRSTFAPAARRGCGLPRYLLVALTALLVWSASLSTARAQSACPIGAPVTVMATTYTLSNNDECHALIFASPTAVSITAPAANTVAPGWQVLLMATGAGITVSSAGTGSTIGPSGTTGIVGGGQSALLFGDGSNYWIGLGLGFQTQAPSGANFTNLNSVFPGVLLGNSPIIAVPNGVLQFTNPASLVPSDRGDINRVCAGVNKAMGAVPGQAPAWLQVFDWLKRPYKIPLC